VFFDRLALLPVIAELTVPVDTERTLIHAVLECDSMRNLLCVIGRHDWQVKHHNEGQPYEICGRPRCYHVQGHDSGSDGPYRHQDSDQPLPPQPPRADPGPAAGAW
jgi:hypothetical protein